MCQDVQVYTNLELIDVYFTLLTEVLALHFSFLFILGKTMGIFVDIFEGSIQIGTTDYIGHAKNVRKNISN